MYAYLSVNTETTSRMEVSSTWFPGATSSTVSRCVVDRPSSGPGTRERSGSGRRRGVSSARRQKRQEFRPNDDRLVTAMTHDRNLIVVCIFKSKC